MFPIVAVVILAACLHNSASARDCPCPDDSWTKGSNDRCFKYFTSPKTFKEAEAVCVNQFEVSGRGYIGHLASVHSEEDVKQLAKMVFDSFHQAVTSMDYEELFTEAFIGLILKPKSCAHWTDATKWDYNWWADPTEERYGTVLWTQVDNPITIEPLKGVRASDNKTLPFFCETYCFHGYIPKEMLTEIV